MMDITGVKLWSCSTGIQNY